MGQNSRPAVMDWETNPAPEAPALPESLKEWKFEPKTPQMISALASSPKDGAQISVVTQSLPIAMPIETMGPMMEMGPKMMEGYKGMYRVRVGSFRIGLYWNGNQLEFVRFLDRKEIYRYFP